MELILFLVTFYLIVGLAYSLYQIKSAIRFSKFCPEELMKDDPQTFIELEMLGFNFTFLTATVFFIYNVLKWPGLIADFGMSELIEEDGTETTLNAPKSVKR